MNKLKLIKARSYNGIVKANRAQPYVEVETNEEAQALIATGYFEPCTSPAPAVVPDDNSGSESAPDYEGLADMTKAELAEYAEQHSIDIEGCKSKADILEAISIANGGSPTMIDLQK